MQFVGTVEYALDKKRVPIPPTYRAAFRDGGYITTGTGPYLVLHTEESFRKAAEQIEALPTETEEGEEVRRDFYGNAAPITPDSQGRVMLADKHIAHAGIDQQVSVVGVGRRLEIWDRATFQAREEQRQAVRRAVIGQGTTNSAGPGA